MDMTSLNGNLLLQHRTKKKRKNILENGN